PRARRRDGAPPRASRRPRRDARPAPRRTPRGARAGHPGSGPRRDRAAGGAARRGAALARHSSHPARRRRAPLGTRRLPRLRPLHRSAKGCTAMTESRQAAPETGPFALGQAPKSPWPALWALVIGFFMILVDTT